MADESDEKPTKGKKDSFEIGVDVKVDFVKLKDERPTKEQWATMPRQHRKKHLSPLDHEGNPMTAESVAMLKEKIRAARSVRRSRKPTVINGRGHTQQSSGVRRNSRAA